LKIDLGGGVFARREPKSIREKNEFAAVLHPGARQILGVIISKDYGHHFYCGTSSHCHNAMQ